ncbi:MAG: hypothetical protein ACXVDH_05560 [Nocardioides sp.]|uniref:hypothetical protein n=1 Tax=Nocardioides nematodiphilus TaxID=2849669 RepID=UPI001CD9AA7E|nr:hypothetical protein [Nocardioides nematodiphilus]MCA1981423.1 hypothetical protein [Nocardioides nematodiphilus]
MSTVEDNDQMDLRLLWLLLIPGILIGAIVVHVIAGHDDLKPSAATSNLSVSVPTQVGRCAVPSAEQLSQFPTAVRAEVTAVGDQAVDLRVQNVLAGPQIGLITVRLPASQLATADTSLPAFVQGHSYLLAIAADNQLAGCGLSGASDTELEELYAKAFG